ncbi:IclR family transcriptional regulator [Kutzneria sp. CA-103260]|uniref:IclR family transcriptional regulator n=1 Tax=Kutzneria sp. CA-103260 TaxID=2802641 RepID=UPI001BA46991|nr:IclR family transcriptional regulator [Kutzneria sp. CA-103260]
MSTALRGLEVLEALAGMRQPAPLRAVAERVGLSESQAFRILQELERAGYLEHLGRSGYRLASRSVALATLIGPRPALLRAVYPVITRLAHNTGEAVVLHLRSGAARVLVLGVPAPTGPTLDPAGVPGERSPLVAGASGRIILAFLPAAELAAMDLAGITPDQLQAIRDRGHEISHGENHPGISGVSVPLLAYSGNEQPTVLGSITVAGPTSRFELSRVLTPLLGACRDLAPRLASILGPDPGAVVQALDL